MIPEDAAIAIENACVPDRYDLEQLGAGIAAASHPLTPIIAAIEANSGDYGQYVHFGATTQDILDTGLVLQMRAALKLQIEAQRNLTQACVVQAKIWRALPMAGRTHGQHAVPVTLGLKFALAGK